MQVETFQDLIDWTRELHGFLAKCLQHCSVQQDEPRAKVLLEYLATHEANLESTVASIPTRRGFRGGNGKPSHFLWLPRHAAAMERVPNFRDLWTRQYE